MARMVPEKKKSHNENAAYHSLVCFVSAPFLLYKCLENQQQHQPLPYLQ